jgi:hypothetical protein
MQLAIYVASTALVRWQLLQSFSDEQQAVSQPSFS